MNKIKAQKIDFVYDLHSWMDFCCCGKYLPLGNVKGGCTRSERGPSARNFAPSMGNAREMAPLDVPSVIVFATYSARKCRRHPARNKTSRSRNLPFAIMR